MKKLNNFQINPERLMKNEELMVLRGGYSFVSCRINGGPCWEFEIDSCDYAREVCNSLCGAGQKQSVLAGD
jgi:hypothetical protein